MLVTLSIPAKNDTAKLAMLIAGCVVLFALLCIVVGPLALGECAEAVFFLGTRAPILVLCLPILGACLGTWQRRLNHARV